jgi:hypothetical protein
MELDEGQLRSVPEGGVLFTLPNGISILRRTKHEPINLAGLSPAQVKLRTDKTNGSKFLRGTGLARIVEITREILEENGVQPGHANGRYAKMCYSPVGISNGRRVKAVRVVTACGSTQAHAYPEDKRRV